mgnify:CR=1 FL=1|tara:strand:- start:182 stop:1321 length:1140 start_codon:yes stop_codon:yes gene_type:complete
MEENKEVTEEVTQETVEQTTEPQVEEKQEESPVSYNEDGDIKLDLTKIPVETIPEENETTETTEVAEDNTVNEGVVGVDEDANAPEEQKEIQPEAQAQEETTIEEVVDLPENLQKLMEFMEETGGDLQDYVKLNTDVQDMDDSEILADFYKQTKPHLNAEEINFLLEDRFSYDEDTEDERDIKRKKLALKEQVAEARSHLEENKSKYYEEIKAGSKLTNDQQKAIEFFNRYNQEEEQNVKIVENQQKTFLNKTDKVFQNFDGFEFNVGDKKIKYNVTDVDSVKNKQVDINNFVGKFLNDGLMEDAAGYHKSLFTAMNPDAIAKHFYEQGKTDAVKQTVAQSKNINTSRESHKVYEGEGGIKFKVLGEDSNDMKLRIKKR